MTKNVKRKPKDRGRKDQAIFYLTLGKGISETADLVGVTRQTIRNWLNSSEFYEEYVKAERKRLNQLGNIYNRADKASFDILNKIMGDENANNSDRIRAAIEIQKQSFRVREFLILEERLARLERQFTRGESGGPKTVHLEFPYPLPMPLEKSEKAEQTAGTE